MQGGLEIECEVVINSRATMLQSRLTARYLDLVKDLYTEPAEDRVVGWKPIQFCHDVTPDGKHTCTSQKKEKGCRKQCFRKWRYKRNVWSIKEEKSPKIIVVDDE